MDRHPLDRNIGSDLSYFCLQRRREELQGRTGAFDSSHQRLRTITGYNPRVFVAEVDEMGGDTANPVPVTVALGAVDSE